MYTVFFFVIVAILVSDFVLEQGLEWLNLKALSTQLPDGLKHIYDPEQYRHSQQYEREQIKFSFISSATIFAVLMSMLLGHGFAWLNQWVCHITSHPILQCLLFFGSIGLGLKIITLPFSIYSTFCLEARYGFNHTTPRLFFTDECKNLLISIVFGAGILSLITWFYGVTTQFFWIYAWLLITTVSLLTSSLYTTLIVPLFNKLEPLPEGSLKSAIHQLAAQMEFNLNDIFTIDSSKRSSKGNAYFSGFGHRKSIVLYDTLIEDLPENEVIAVLAHEIGHYKEKHILWGMCFSTLHNGIMLFLLSLCISSPALSNALSIAQPSFHVGLMAFVLLYSPVSLIMDLGMNYMTRKFELQADLFSSTYTHEKDDLIKALCTLSVKNLTNLTPHPWYVIFNYSHPPLLQRIQNIEASYTSPK